MYLAVIPFYRQYCVDELYRRLGSSLRLYAGSEHTDPTVRTGIGHADYRLVKNRFLLGRRLLLQTGCWKDVLRAETAVLDLNPRSLSTWVLTAARKALGRRTLLWGHLYPRKGRAAGTGWLRRGLRRMGSGTILYGYGTVAAALEDLPDSPVWVAPNALYPREILQAADDRAADPQASDHSSTDGRSATTGVGRSMRERLTYVGRLTGAKKVELLVRGHAASQASRAGSRLTIVGDGDQRQQLEDVADRSGCRDSVEFLGWITDVDALRKIYADSFTAASPGYAGLSLTQSLGFGVPVLVAKDEPHSPEIELDRFGGVEYFESDNVDALAAAIDVAWSRRGEIDPGSLSRDVIALYSAEAMAAGIVDALNEEPLQTRADGWPAWLT